MTFISKLKTEIQMVETEIEKVYEEVRVEVGTKAATNPAAVVEKATKEAAPATLPEAPKISATVQMAIDQAAARKIKDEYHGFK